ncbi:hypothetical protein QUF74_02160 [Candidatus Halobeggiatoa sp. HSG11]|nr:hypothetical protein [Candidatus Halobeggiatoa sp. HSG11]
MSTEKGIELELRLEGEDANEETLLDLMDWLERAGIDGLEVKRKESPPVKGDMGFWTDPNTIMTMISTGIAVVQVMAAILQWQKNKKVTVTPKITDSNKEMVELNSQIQVILDKMKDHK